ncbi:cytochrome P450 [Streptomyces sp. A1499]|uniref:cytochrome P450 n=1 Tax=Streptomyces sp. A1499 TaxID=2563104 RepID=UPI00109E9297|nr:cytochrome P450 [Streptomyces sp. A1499]THC55198.1 cytochrome P450 [Streptomyces sp. A1499]
MSRASTAPTGCPYQGDAGTTTDPCRDYLGLREDEPVRWDEDLELWFVTGFREATSLLHHPSLSSAWPERGSTPLHAAAGGGSGDGARTSGLVRKWFMFNDNPSHRRARRLVAPLFSADRVAGHRPFIQEVVEELLSKDRDSLDVMGDLAIPLSGRVICRILGLDAALAPHLEPWALDVAALLVADYMPDVVTRGHAALEDMTGLIDQALEGDLPEGSALHLLRTAQQDGEIELQDVWATASFLVYAGFETTSSFIGKAVRSILHSGSWAQLGEADMGAAVEELLRFDTSVQQVARLATDTIEIAGKRIAAGDLVLIMLGTANRDPEVFDRPDHLDHGRRITRHLGFGHGAHYCLGAGLARLEAQFALEGLREKWPTLRFREPPRTRSHFGITVLEHLVVESGDPAL